MIRSIKTTFFLLGLLAAAQIAAGQPTKLLVRVKAKDGKFIGSNIGGALVVVRDHATGEILARGSTEGASGNTKLIMETPHGRYDRLSDDKTAGYLATIDLKEPVFADVQASAPAQLKGGSVTGSTQLWLIPGKDIDGEGLVVELPGFILNVISPTLHQILPFQAGKPVAVDLKISLTMLCGCPISHSGTWNADDLEVVATLTRDGKPLEQKTLTLTAQDNIFAAPFTVDSKGSYGFTVTAYSRKTKNTGVDHIFFFVN